MTSLTTSLLPFKSERFETSQMQHPIKEEEFKINELPSEIFAYVLSHLNPQDTVAAVGVSQNWKEFTIDTTKRKEFSLIIAFANSLSDHLTDEYSSQRKNFLKSATTKKFSIL